MLKSMTGFGVGDFENEDYQVHVEIRAVNQRFLELAFHMPRTLFAWEDTIRQIIRKYAARGKLDIQISFRDKRERTACVRVDHGLALAYQKALNELGDTLHLARPDDLAAIAAYPDVLTVEEDTSLAGMEGALVPAVEQAAVHLDAMRLREGENIGRDFTYRLGLLQDMVNKVDALAPVIVENYRTRIRETLKELLAEQEPDETRIVQEVGIYSDRVNVTEELVRLRSHFEQFRVIQQESDEPVGRKLDFLIQEMNRETNTIGSKANHAEAARIVVDMKSEIEKIREQVQNIE